MQNPIIKKNICQYLGPARRWDVGAFTCLSPGSHNLISHSTSVHTTSDERSPPLPFTLYVTTQRASLTPYVTGVLNASYLPTQPPLPGRPRQPPQAPLLCEPLSKYYHHSPITKQTKHTSSAQNNGAAEDMRG